MTETDRYARQLVLPGFGVEAQQRLGEARVLIIGAGGLGSAVMPSLVAAGVGTIGIVDDDVVELSNLHRQLMHGVSDVGSAKTESAVRSAAAIDSRTEVLQFPVRLTSANALGIVGGFDLVIDGSDNFPTRYLANDVAALSRLPLVWGAVSQYSGQAGVAWAERGPQYRDLFPSPPPPGSVQSCEIGGVLPTVVAVIGSIMATEALKILAGVGAPLIGRVTTFDALTGGFRELAYERDPAGWPITGLIDYELFCGLPSQSETVTADELAVELATDRPPVLVDVREVWEAEIATLPGALLVPLATLESAELDPAATIVLYCHHGIRSATALDVLRDRGFTAVRHLEGGIDAWARTVEPEMSRY